MLQSIAICRRSPRLALILVAILAALALVLAACSYWTRDSEVIQTEATAAGASAAPHQLHGAPLWALLEKTELISISAAGQNSTLSLTGREELLRQLGKLKLKNLVLNESAPLPVDPTLPTLSLPELDLNITFTPLSSQILFHTPYAQFIWDSQDQACTAALATLIGEQSNKLQTIQSHPERYDEILQLIAEKNPETQNFVMDYPQLYGQASTDKLQASDRVGRLAQFVQWDPRWGYEPYCGGVIGYNGCGPTALSIVIDYFKPDLGLTPLKLARFASEQGYAIEGQGTSWDFFQAAAQKYHFQIEQLPVTPLAITEALDQGKLLIFSMGPGDFTSVGHFIVIHSYTDEGLRVQDPNSRLRSAKIWPLSQISDQILSIWAFSEEGGGANAAGSESNLEGTNKIEP